MKKLAACMMMAVCLFSLTACSQQKTGSDNIQDIVADGTYLYEKEGFGGKFAIQINEDGTFTYYEGLLSSHIGMGNWELDDDVIVLSEDGEMGYPFVNRFQVDGSDLVFISEDSSNFLYINVADGERFTNTSDEII